MKKRTKLKKLPPYTLVRMKDGIEKQWYVENLPDHVLLKPKGLLFVHEVSNMPGHGVFATTDGEIIPGFLHISSFEPLPIDEV